MTPDKQQSEPDKPHIEQAINWLASHSGEYSVVLLDYIAELGFANESLHRDKLELSRQLDEENKCQHCNKKYEEGTPEAEFIGWHGLCAECELNNVEKCNG